MERGLVCAEIEFIRSACRAARRLAAYWPCAWPEERFRRVRKACSAEERTIASALAVPCEPLDLHMFHWAIVFLLIALIAGAFGFGGIAGTAAGFAKVIFFVALVLLVIALVRGRGPRV